MDSDRLNRWLSLAANLGILAGLVLVAVQINQNSQLVRLQLINEGNVALNHIWANAMGENPTDAIAISIEHPEEMTYADFMAVDAWLYSSMNLFYRNYELAQEGLFGERDWQAGVEAYAPWFLSNGFGRAWWHEEARHFFAPEFAGYVDEQLARQGPAAMDSEAYWRAIQSRLREE